MKKLILFALLYLAFASATVSAQDRVRIGVPLFPTVSYPVLIAQEKGFFEKTV
jgi:ABC-type nitrate/sulfonate/bicarbonate transport system substrate-binding protein